MSRWRFLKFENSKAITRLECFCPRGRTKYCRFRGSVRCLALFLKHDTKRSPCNQQLPALLFLVITWPIGMSRLSEENLHLLMLAEHIYTIIPLKANNLLCYKEEIQIFATFKPGSGFHRGENPFFALDSRFVRPQTRSNPGQRNTPFQTRFAGKLTGAMSNPFQPFLSLLFTRLPQ